MSMGSQAGQNPREAFGGGGMNNALAVTVFVVVLAICAGVTFATGVVWEPWGFLLFIPEFIFLSWSPLRSKLPTSGSGGWCCGWAALSASEGPACST